jgi:hypothetical protein
MNNPEHLIALVLLGLTLGGIHQIRVWLFRKER